MKKKKTQRSAKVPASPGGATTQPCKWFWNFSWEMKNISYFDFQKSRKKKISQNVWVSGIKLFRKKRYLCNTHMWYILWLRTKAKFLTYTELLTSILPRDVEIVDSLEGIYMIAEKLKTPDVELDVREFNGWNYKGIDSSPKVSCLLYIRVKSLPGLWG